MSDFFLTEDDRKRFEAKVRAVVTCRDGKLGVCWAWQGTVSDGTARFWVDTGRPGGDAEYAKRIAWELYVGEIPEGRSIIRMCQTQLCVNPAHHRIGPLAAKLRAGTSPEERLRADRERFMSYVSKQPTGCWLWTGGGWVYGRFTLNNRSIGAHRASCILFKGVDPGELVGMEGMHSCDDTRCVCPAHIDVGTHKQNMEDKVQKGRQVMGERHGNARLTDDLVASIKGEYREGVPNEGSRIARKYLITETMVSSIVRGNSWKHVEIQLGSIPSGDPPALRQAIGERHGNSKLTDAQVVEMRELRAQGWTPTRLAAKYGIKDAQASAICTGRERQHLGGPRVTGRKHLTNMEGAT